MTRRKAIPPRDDENGTLLSIGKAIYWHDNDGNVVHATVSDMTPLSRRYKYEGVEIEYERDEDDEEDDS